MYISTFFTYSIFGFISILLAYLSQVCNRYSHRVLLIIFAYILVVSFWSFRYGIGFDYDSYIFIYYEIKNGYSSYVEPAFYFISKLFSKISHGEYWVIASMSILTYLFLFYVLVKKNVLWLGLLFSLAFQYQFMAANQIRQALAISAFLCLLSLIERKQTLKWCIGIVLITLLFHTSALFLFFLIPFCQIRISGKKWCLIISILYIAYLSGIFHQFGNLLLTTLPVTENYQHFISSDRINPEQIGFSLVMLFNVLVALYIAWNWQLNEKRIFTLYMIGICMYIVFIEYHLLLRLSFYLLYVNIYIASLFCEEQSKKGVWLILATIIFSLFNFAQSTNYHGVIPYRTLFSYI